MGTDDWSAIVTMIEHQEGVRLGQNRGLEYVAVPDDDRKTKGTFGRAGTAGLI
jgi:hypothetical protein